MDARAATRSLSKVERATEYEFYDLMLPRTVSRNATLRLLTEHAEYGHWELARLRLFPDGTRKVVLRRKIIRMRRFT